MKTKLTLSAILIALFSTTVCFSQDSKATIGFKAGANLPILSEIAEGTKSQLGYLVGLTFNYKLPKNSIGAELYYDKSAFNNDLTGTYLSMEKINIPVYYQGDLGSKFTAKAGFEVNFLINSRITTDFIDANAKEALSSTGISYLGGFGYKINSKIGIDLRYTSSLTAISDYETTKLGRFALSANLKF